MIRHILLIRFTDAATERQLTKVQHAFLKIPELVEGVMSVEWGENNSPEGKNSGFTHCVLMSFYDETARLRYLRHSGHIALKTIFKPVLRDIIVFDYTQITFSGKKTV